MTCRPIHEAAKKGAHTFGLKFLQLTLLLSHARSTTYRTLLERLRFLLRASGVVAAASYLPFLLSLRYPAQCALGCSQLSADFCAVLFSATADKKRWSLRC